MSTVVAGERASIGGWLRSVAAIADSSDSRAASTPDDISDEKRAALQERLQSRYAQDELSWEALADALKDQRHQAVAKRAYGEFMQLLRSAAGEALDDRGLRVLALNVWRVLLAVDISASKRREALADVMGRPLQSGEIGGFSEVAERLASFVARPLLVPRLPVPRRPAPPADGSGAGLAGKRALDIDANVRRLTLFQAGSWYERVPLRFPVAAGAAARAALHEGTVPAAALSDGDAQRATYVPAVRDARLASRLQQFRALVGAGSSVDDAAGTVAASAAVPAAASSSSAVAAAASSSAAAAASSSAPASAAPASVLTAARASLERRLRGFFADRHTELSPAQMVDLLWAPLSSSRSDDEIQEELFETLGVEGFDLIPALLAERNEYRDAVLRAASAVARSAAPAVPAAAFESIGPQLLGGGAAALPARGGGGSGYATATSMTIASESDLRAMKAARKAEKRAYQKGGAEFLSEDQEALVNARAMREAREAELRYNAEMARDIIAELPVSVEDAPPTRSFISPTVVIPAVRKRHQFYDEITIPPDAPVDRSHVKRVAVTELPEFAQPAFTGIAQLNLIQSTVYETAFQSNTNMLVCAPTGAGKTNIALLAILHEIGTHIEGGSVRRDDFKIVYVAPMKALAAEMVANFTRRLKYLGIVVRELTGDMQLSKKEIAETQVIVTTPEKWDVITRKSTDTPLAQLVRLLIIDEVHLLHDDRGPVIETLVARTLRQVEVTQTATRIVGLSATLPNYRDVAEFLRVAPERGLFHFDASYRPVPLTQRFFAIRERDPMAKLRHMMDVTFQLCHDTVRSGKQSMVFVHSRKDAVNTAQALRQMATMLGKTTVFHVQANRDGRLPTIPRSQSHELNDLMPAGFGFHHAGMSRSDRHAAEKMFADGVIKVLVCTATLAWGVNLPAHQVIIKGTSLYNPEKSAFVDLGMLDVQQIFGRAGRPQYEDSGEGVIISDYEKINLYLRQLFRQLPIESNFVTNLADNLNAEVVLGTVSNISEAVQWLSYTYLMLRMKRNPMVYGVSYEQLAQDPHLFNRRHTLIRDAALALDRAQMARFHARTGQLAATDLGRIASHFYIKCETIETFNEMLKESMTQGELLTMMCRAGEFRQIKVRDDELNELDTLKRDYCHIPLTTGVEGPEGKTNVLVQAYLSNAPLRSFSLASDSNYVLQNIGRICRGIFNIVLKRGWPLAAEHVLTLAKMIENRMWSDDHPLRQLRILPEPVLSRLESTRATLDELYEMDKAELGALIHNHSMAETVMRGLRRLPYVDAEVTIQPITRTVLRLTIHLIVDFEWQDSVHSAAEYFHLWIEDAENTCIYHTELLVLRKVDYRDERRIVCTIPIFEPLPPQYFLRICSDRWFGVDNVVPISFKHLILPALHPPHTNLLDLQPLPVSALRNAKYQSLYRFSHFNPIQTQVFHTLYHTDHNVLLGAPTGSGKTIAAEIAMMRLFNESPKAKVIYIAPLKALVRERISDWQAHLGKVLGKRVVELTGDFTPDQRALREAHVVVTTPEKWDGISRAWHIRSYVRDVGLVIIDEIHLLGADRGPILEVIVSRMRYIASHTAARIRIIGLSTALANARDLAGWLGIDEVGLFNFRPSVRPVPLEVHIQGFTGKHYCPRMNSMNKPAFNAIEQHSPDKPVLIFVSSRRQTRLTARDLITYCTLSEMPKRFVNMDEAEAQRLAGGVRDDALKETLVYGVGIHHAGLTDGDRSLVERLFEQGKITVLVSTATLAWGINLPAHLVIVKGTEFFDAQKHQYVDYPITDILQMMGRAGRPQYDNMGKAMIFVQEEKKNFVKKFLYEPFPVESSLAGQIHNHLNAEVVGGTIATLQDAVDYMTWTYYYRRLTMNPTYYNLEDCTPQGVSKFLSDMVMSAVVELQRAGCVALDEDGGLQSETLGRVASYYYLDYKTMQLLRDSIKREITVVNLLQVMCDCAEFDELPVRHNEDVQNKELSESVPFAVQGAFDSPHTKAFLLLMCHVFRLPLPIADYVTDTKSVLDNAPRVVQGMVDVAANEGYLSTTLFCMHWAQMLTQARFLRDNPLLTLPHVNANVVARLQDHDAMSLPHLLEMHHANRSATYALLMRCGLSERQAGAVSGTLDQLPLLTMSVRVRRDTEAEQASGVAGTAEREFVLDVKLSCARLRRSDGFAVAPSFPKPKQEAWWLVLGNERADDLLAVKRVTCANGELETQLECGGVLPDSLTLYAISDCYLGLDASASVVLGAIDA